MQSRLIRLKVDVGPLVPDGPGSGFVVALLNPEAHHGCPGGVHDAGGFLLPSRLNPTVMDVAPAVPGFFLPSSFARGKMKPLLARKPVTVPRCHSHAAIEDSSCASGTCNGLSRVSLATIEPRVSGNDRAILLDRESATPLVRLQGSDYVARLTELPS
jgi:hypothetical protein